MGRAMPVLEDLARLLGEPIMEADVPPEMVRQVRRSLEAAIEKLPIFARQTRLGLGEARVVSINRQDVAPRHTSTEAERSDALTFMIARQACLSKILVFPMKSRRWIPRRMKRSMQDTSCIGRRTTTRWPRYPSACAWTSTT